MALGKGLKEESMTELARNEDGAIILVRVDLADVRNDGPPLMCCDPSCPEYAEWQIHWEPNDRGATPDDYTESCTRHVGNLLQEGSVNHVYPLKSGSETSA